MLLPVVVCDFQKVINLAIDQFKYPLLSHFSCITKLRCRSEFHEANSVRRSRLHQEILQRFAGIFQIFEIDEDLYNLSQILGV